MPETGDVRDLRWQRARVAELAVLIPTLNSEQALIPLLDSLKGEAERIVVTDGGSEDGTLRAALRRGAVIAAGSPGRGHQLRRGAEFALQTLGDDAWLLALHADSHLPVGWRTMIDTHIRTQPARAAHFRFGGLGKWLDLATLKSFVRLRELAWALPYGDQGLLVSARLYREVGGYHDMALFEDVDLVTRLRRTSGRLVRLPGEIRTDISHHTRQGVWRRGWQNLRLLSAYRDGVGIEELVRRYEAGKK